MNDSSDQYRAARAEKAARLRALGLDPYGRTFAPTHAVAQARRLCPAFVDGAPEQTKGERVVLAGRVGNLRASGKLWFASLFDRSRADLYREQQLAGLGDLDGADAKKARGIQLMLDFKVLGETQWQMIQCLDLADWIGVAGRLGRSKRGEISVFNSVSVRPLLLKRRPRNGM